MLAKTIAIGAVAMLVALAGCEKSDEIRSDKSAAAPKLVPKVNTKGAKLTLTKDGVQLEPPVEKSRIPQGAWFCDMGTVHYARTKKGDGLCALCGMKLVEKGANAAGGHDHEHGADEHGHPDDHGHEH